jgi:hypothetical protein
MKRVAELMVLVVGVLSASVVHAQTTPKSAQFASGSLAFGSVTGSYVKVLDGAVQFRNIDILNATDQDALCSWDDGTTSVRVPAYSSFNGDLRQLSLFVGATELKCKHAGVAPTVGSINAFGMY